MIKRHTQTLGTEIIENLFTTRNATENGLSTVGRRSKKRSAVTESDWSSTREHSSLGEDPPWPQWWETIDLQDQGPPAKRARREQTSKETAPLGQDRNCQSTRTNVTPVQSPAFKLQIKRKVIPYSVFVWEHVSYFLKKIDWLIEDNLFIF